jgi:tyrosinase
MKAITSLFLSGAAVTSAAVVARDGALDYCPATVKAVYVSHLELSEFPVAHTWSWDQAKECVDNSRPDLSQVYPDLGNTSNAYAASNSTGRAYQSTSTRAASAPYQTGGIYGNSNATVLPTGGLVVSSSASTVPGSPTSAPASPSATGVCNSPRVRVEWRNLGDSQRDAYVGAVRCLMNRPSSNTGIFRGSRNLFEDLVSLHQQLVGSVHGGGNFLVWHRYFIHVYHSLLVDECGYTGPYVWWDETRDAGNFARAPMFTSRWFGELSAGAGGRGVCVRESGFGAYEANLGPNGAINNPHCLSRAVDESLTINTNQDWLNNCNRAQNYNDFRQCCELTYHAYGHNGVGSVMSNVAASPEDPVFYLHHGFVDFAYKVWQNGGSTRTREVGGSNLNGGTVNPADVLTSYGLRPDATVAQVLDTEGDYLCYVYDNE